MAFGLSPLVEFLRMDEATPDGVIIDGIEFLLVPTAAMPLRQTMYLASESALVGIRPMEDYAALGDPTKVGLAIMSDAYRSGHAFTFLAAFFVRKGTKWSEEQVAENAAILADATGDAGTALVTLLGGAAKDFFGSGTSSSPTSPTSSPAATTDKPGPASPIDSPAPLRATTEPSTARSAISPKETATGTTRSSAGKPARSSSRGGRSRASGPAMSGASTTSGG